MALELCDKKYENLTPPLQLYHSSHFTPNTHFTILFKKEKRKNTLFFQKKKWHPKMFILENSNLSISDKKFDLKNQSLN